MSNLPGWFNCRGCGGNTMTIGSSFADLGAMPLANALLSRADLEKPESHYPLRVVTCSLCHLVQLLATPPAQTLFADDYPFYAGQSAPWVEHCGDLAAQLTERLKLTSDDFVLDLGSNDGTLIRAFQQQSVRAAGVEPCRDVAEYALARGASTLIGFWSSVYARQMHTTGYRAQLVTGTNVLAHVPDPRDFLRGVSTILAPDGLAVFEVPHVANLITGRQWDQIYHEHHCYFSLHSLSMVLGVVGLHVVDVETTAVHGGSLRVFAAPRAGRSDAVLEMQKHERDIGLADHRTYRQFAGVPVEDKRRLLHKLTHADTGGLVGYGASAKAAVICNYCGIGPETMSCVVDTTPAKQGKYMPGVRIPIVAPRDAPAEVSRVLNFCWNWPEASEAHIRAMWPDAQIVYPHGQLVPA